MTELSKRLRDNADIDEAEGCNPLVVLLEREAADALDAQAREIAELTRERDEALQAVDAFADICDELGVERDNEAGLAAARDLTSKLEEAAIRLDYWGDPQMADSLRTTLSTIRGEKL